MFLVSTGMVSVVYTRWVVYVLLLASLITYCVYYVAFLQQISTKGFAWIEGAHRWGREESEESARAGTFRWSGLYFVPEVVTSAHHNSLWSLILPRVSFTGSWPWYFALFLLSDIVLYDCFNQIYLVRGIFENKGFEALSISRSMFGQKDSQAHLQMRESWVMLR